jgi:hypothetical protein
LAQKLLNLWAESGANIIDDDTVATLTLQNTGTGACLETRQTSSAATVATLRCLNSAASGVFIDFVGGILSSASINMAANKVVAAVRVHFKSVGGDGYGYIPIMTGVS